MKVNMKYQLVEVEEEEGGGSGEAGDAALGRLSKSQIEKGQEVLVQLRDIVSGAASGGKKASNFGSTVSELSGRFYSLIPTKFGRKVPEPLNNMELIQAKESLLDFWLRMGFEDMEEKPVGSSPIDGVMDLPVPASLHDAAIAISDAHSIHASEEKAKQLAASGAGNPVKPMAVKLYAAIMLYTGNSVYAKLNQVLRAEDHKAARRYFSYLRLFLEAMNCMPTRDVTLWRGISVDLYDQYTEDKVITWWSVSSCTADQNVVTCVVSHS